MHLGQAGNRPHDDVFDARLRGGGDRDGVAVATQAVGRPEDVNLFDGGGSGLVDPYGTVASGHDGGPFRAKLPACLIRLRRLCLRPGEAIFDSGHEYGTADDVAERVQSKNRPKSAAADSLAGKLTANIYGRSRAISMVQMPTKPIAVVTSQTTTTWLIVPDRRRPAKTASPMSQPARIPLANRPPA